MKEYKVVITDSALHDMAEIYNYISDRLLSPENAAGQYDRIAEGILKLAVLPGRFGIIDAEPWKTKGLRRMLVDNYSVFYVVRNETVIVTAVLYSASDLGKRLEQKPLD